MTALQQLEAAEAATAAALKTAPWSTDPQGLMLIDRNGNPLLRHLANGSAWSWDKDFEPIFAPEVISYFLAMNPAAMLPILQQMREFMQMLESNTPQGPFLSPAEEEAILRDALETMGTETQLNKCAEECGELIAVLNQWREGRATNAHSAEEVADTRLMNNQMRLFFGPQLVDTIYYQKLLRLKERIAAHKKEGK